MITRGKNLQDVGSPVNGWEPNFGDRLLASNLVSEIIKSKDHISLTFTGEGAIAFAKALREVPEQEAKAVQEASPELNLIPKREVMERLSVTHATLWNWEKKKYLVPVKIGRRVFYRCEDINKLQRGE